MGSTMSFTAAGDCFITRRLPGRSESFFEISSIIKKGEARFMNLEVTVHDHEGYPSAVCGGTWAMALPEVLNDLKDYGFNLVAWANAVIGHGQHVLRGIEIYHKCPIFYSLGNFIFQNETVTSLPQDFYDSYGLGYTCSIADALDIRSDNNKRGFGMKPNVWQTVIPFWTMEDGELKDLTLYPVELGFDQPRYRRGWPEVSQSTEILEKIRKLSLPFGTCIEIDNCTGKVRL